MINCILLVLLLLVSMVLGKCTNSKWLNEYDLNKPKFYLRYVNDIPAAFDNGHDSLNFLDFLNTWHPNIKFTIKNKLTIASLFLMYTFQVSIIKISHLKHITN